MSFVQFKNLVWDYYKHNKRHFPWRDTKDPYYILVSEIMLQQTRVSRVVAKYESFLKKFPIIDILANASLEEVLKEWQGLGYNRRGMYLKKSVEIIMSEYKGNVPRNPEALIQLPGIGINTAGSISVFAYNIPVPFIETNIRTVFIYCFFKKTKRMINDQELLKCIEKTLDKENPREWYYALMDYGAMLKNKHGNPNYKSTHYRRQSPFKGSNREVRSWILKEILKKAQGEEEIKNELQSVGEDVIEKNLSALVREGFVKKKNNIYSII